MTEMLTLTITDIAAQLKSRKISSVELTQACLDRIRNTDDKLRAYVRVEADAALASARQTDEEISAGDYRGPLHGVPIAVKDLCDIAGLPTTSSSLIRQDYIAQTDAAVVERLKVAGAVIVGKTHTHEFAYGIVTPTTRNPWNLNSIPGGSSGGSGAAVAAGSAFMGIGTDTGGSIRIPASLCGTVGLKPTYGRVSRAGITSLSWSLDHAGPLTRSVRDAAVSLAVLAGYDPRDPGSINMPVPDYLQDLGGDIKGLRIGVPKNFFFDRIDPAVATSVRAAIGHMESIGATLTEVELPFAKYYEAVEFGICMPEATAYHQYMLRESAAKYNEDVRIFLEVGELIPAADYIKSLRVRHRIQAGWREMFRDIDVLVAPTVPAVAADVGQTSFRWDDGSEQTITSAYVTFSCPANITGLPSISVPCGFTERRLPVGMQIIGRPFDEATILRAAHAYESTTDWHLSRPPL